MGEIMFDLSPEDIKKAFDEAEKKFKEVYEPFIEEVRKSIKHPHFYYADVDLDKMEISYHKKKWYKWFSGKRIVRLKPPKIECPSLPIYKPNHTDE